MEITIGGLCPVCSYERMFIVNSSLERLAFQCCPNCTFTYNSLGLLSFDEIVHQITYRLSVCAAKNEIESAGVYPDADRDRDCDPYYSLLRDFVILYQGYYNQMTPHHQRLNLMTITLNAERKMLINLCEPPAELVSTFKNTNPPKLNR